MPKSIHKLPEAEIDDLVATAIIDEHCQTRRPVRTDLVCIAVNAAAAADQEAVLWSLVRLKRAGKIARQHPDGTWLPLDPVGTPAEPETDAAPCNGCDSQPGEFHSPECGAVNAFQTGRIPDTVPEIRDPMPEEFIDERDPMVGNKRQDNSTCRDCGKELTFEEAYFIATGQCSLCSGVPMPSRMPFKQAVEQVAARFNNCQEAMRSFSKSAQEIPCTQERIDHGLSAALLDRCAAMNMALMVDARRRYDAGNTDAARELSWLMETGRLLRDAGGAHG